MPDHLTSLEKKVMKTVKKAADSRQTGDEDFQVTPAATQHPKKCHTKRHFCPNHQVSQGKSVTPAAAKVEENAKHI